MNINQMTTSVQDKKGLLSTLWIYLTVNYIYCDHLGIMAPGVIKDLLSGHVGTIQITQEFLLAAAILMQIPFIMIVLARVLPYRVNRWVNIIAAGIMIAVQVGTMGAGTAPSLVYLFYSAIEIAANLMVIWLAWRWTNPKATVSAA
jgi:hypothetical protein